MVQREMDMYIQIFIFIVISSTLLIEAISSTVKITDMNIIYVNNEIISEAAIEDDLQTMNETYTKFHTLWDIKRNFPKDTQLVVKLIRYKSDDDTEEYIDTYSTYICDLNDPNRQYLPDFLVNLTKDGRCIQQGTYDIPDAGQFKFYNLLSDDDIKGFSFKAFHVLLAPDLIIKQLWIYSKSV